MIENPFAQLPMSDPKTRIYHVDDYRQSSPGDVRPSPMYRGDELSSAVFQLLPGQEHKTHVHDDVSHAWVVLQGLGECLMEDGRIEPLRPGSVCFHPRTRPHGVRNTGAENLIYVTVSVSSES
jgi:mannose-6-phosphate isomerase-like protein (cupin superfamily)